MDTLGELMPNDTRRRGHGENRNSKSRLKDFYGTSSDSAKASTGGPMDINGQQFSAETYVTKLQQEKSLLSLAKANSNLISEIKTLDGDMKTLVYENYERFLTATDTMKNIRKTLETMQSEMALLNAKMNEISTNSNNLSSAFSEKSLKMRSLNNKQVLLHKVQYIFDFPAQLKMFVTQGKFLEAVKSYHKIADVLERYGDIPAFSKLRTETNDILKELANKLTTRLKSATLLQEIAECTSCLGMLKYNPLELGRQYISLASKSLNSMADQNTSGKDIEPYIDRIFKGKVSGLRLFTELFYIMFIPGSSEQNKLRFDKDSQLFAVVVDPEVFKLLETEIINLTDSLVSFSYNEIRKKISEQHAGNGGNEQISKRLDMIESFNRKADSIQCKNSSASHLIIQKAKDIYCDMIKMEIHGTFGDMGKIVETALSELSTSKFENYFNDNLSILLDRINLIAFFNASESALYQNTVKESIKLELFDFWMETIEQLKQSVASSRFTIKPDSENVSPVIRVFYIALLCETCVSLVKHSFYRVFQAEGPVFRFTSPHESPEIDETVDEIVIIMKSTSLYFKKLFVKKSVQELILYFESKCQKEQYSEIWLYLTSKLTDIDTALLSLLSEETKTSDDSDSLKRSISYRTDSSTQISQMGRSLDRFRNSSLSSSTPLSSKLNGSIKPQEYLNNIDRLLSDRMEFFDSKIPSTKGAIMSLIVKLLLKASIEIYRLTPRVNVYFQTQVQSDAKFIKNNLTKYAEDDRLMSSLIDEMLRSTSRVYTAE